jgi:DNA polymerase-3 subunit alpha
MAATLSSEIGNTDKIVLLIDDCRKLELRVLPPDVNESGKDFQVIGGDIRFGLCAIKNVGESAVESIIAARRADGPFRNLFDFCRRVDLRLVNKKCLESLVQAGAFDATEGHRALFLENIERSATYGQAFQSEAHNGQSSLFEASAGTPAPTISFPAMVPSTPWPEAEKLAREKSVLGFYVSGHPLLRFEQEINEFANVHFGDLGGFKDGSTVRACGIVTGVKRKIDKRNNTMAFVGLEDFSGKAECIVFSDAFTKFQQHLQPDAMVMVIGKGESNGDALKILVNEVYPLEAVREKFTRSIILSINVNDVQEQTIVRLRELMERNRGNCPCFLNVTDAATTRVYHTRKYSVDVSDAFLREARQMLGSRSVRCTA